MCMGLFLGGDTNLVTVVAVERTQGAGALDSK